MRDIALLTFVTLDGVMQAPSMPEEDPSGGFKKGGWAAPWWEGTMAQVEREAMAQPYDMLFGRRTYDMFAAHWPDAPESPLTDRMNKARKYVVTSSPDTLCWGNTTAITGDIVAELQEAKSEPGPLLQVHGSAQLIQTLLRHDLVDELRLWTFPVVVGSGKRLFEQETPARSFQLLRSEPNDAGTVMSIYRRA